MTKANSSVLITTFVTMVRQVRVRKGQEVPGRGVVNFYICEGKGSLFEILIKISRPA